MKWNTIQAWILGTSIVCLAFRNPIMQIGLVVGAILSINIIIHALFQKKVDLGSKFVYIPLIIICLSIIASSITRYFDNGNLAQMIGSSFMGIYLFMLYIVARIFGKELFKPFAWAVVIETISLVVFNIIIYHGIRGGGLASTTGYNIAVGLLTFGAIVSISNKQWVVVTISLFGLLLTGAEEALFIIPCMLVSMLIRKDISWKMLVPIGSVIVILVLGLFPFNYTKTLYASAIDKVDMALFNKHYEYASEYYVYEPGEFDSQLDFLTNGRLSLINNIDWEKPFGRGYQMLPAMVKDETLTPIHNVPFVIVQQVGIPAALAWMFLIIYCLIKTKWKYAFISVLVMCVFDNYMWAQLGAFVITLVGVSTKDNVNDLIWRKHVKQEYYQTI